MQYAVWGKGSSCWFFVAGWGTIWLGVWINSFDMRERELQAFVQFGGEPYI